MLAFHRAICTGCSWKWC